MRHIESQLQQAFFRWQELAHPELHYLCFAIPNGGKRNLREAVRLKQEGVKAGVGDTFLAVPFKHLGTTFHGLFIEFKAPGGKPTDNQTAFCKVVSEMQYYYEIVYDLDRAIWLVTQALKNRVATWQS